LDEYRYPGFRPRAKVRGIFGDPKARVIELERVQKKRSVDVAARRIEAITTRGCGECEICPAGMHEYIWSWKFGGFSARGVGR
jgi:hypothetical protein